MKKITSLLLALTFILGSACLLVSCGSKNKDGGAQIKVYLGEKIYDFDPTDYLYAGYKAVEAEIEV